MRLLFCWLSLISVAVASDYEAYQSLQQGDAKTAAEQAQSPAWQGVTRFETGDYQAAIEAFDQDDSDTAAYNAATSRAFAGDVEGAIAGYEALLALQPEHMDAKHNLEVLKREQSSSEQSSEGESGEDEQQTEPNDQGQGRSEQNAEQSQSAQTGDTEGEPTQPQQAQAAPTADPRDAEPLDFDEQAVEQWLGRVKEGDLNLLKQRVYMMHRRDHRNLVRPPAGQW
ncbi:MAG: hypothetical protein HWE20_01710 [Gammaproteobacteria bacterium]|nr:hypothetical protein [Gammaproteobacteria bacterium]